MPRLTASEPACLAHPADRAIAVCASCDRGMCGECWQQLLDGRPFCPPCIALARHAVPALVPVLGVTLVTVVVILLPFAASVDAWGSAAGAAGLSAIAAWRLTKKANGRRAGRKLTDRTAEPSVDSPLAAHPYRGAARRLARRVAPPVSGRMAVFVVGSALVAAASAIPTVLHLPRWVEIELVVAAWWVVLTSTLTFLLHRGWRIAHETEGAAVPLFGGGAGGTWEWSDLSGWAWRDWSGCIDLEGVAILVGTLVAVLLGWLIVELIVPAVVFGAYMLLVAALRRVANDTHGCDGRLLPALAWGTLWATIYTLPLVALVWLVHVVMKR